MSAASDGEPQDSIFSASSNDASLPGLLVALMSLFDSDGSHTLSKREWMDGNAALELRTSDEEWSMLLKRFGYCPHAFHRYCVVP